VWVGRPFNSPKRRFSARAVRKTRYVGHMRSSRLQIEDSSELKSLEGLVYPGDPRVRAEGMEPVPVPRYAVVPCGHAKAFTGWPSLSGPHRGSRAPVTLSTVNVIGVPFSYGYAGRLTALCGGFRRGQGGRQDRDRLRRGVAALRLRARPGVGPRCGPARGG
jgi:hypothetical protein